MTQHSGTASVLSIMHELQQLREKVYIYSEKNRELAKALTAVKQELSKTRVAHSTAFSNKVIQWMESSCKPIAMNHQAVQCCIETSDEDSRPLSKNKASELRKQHSSIQSGEVNGVQCSELQRFPRLALAKSRKATVRANEMVEDVEHHKGGKDTIPIDFKSDELKGCPVTLTSQSSGPPFNQVQTSEQTSLKRRLRQRDSSISYIEPKLNTKLRRGDYYGLGKRTGRAESVLNLRHFYALPTFEQQCSPFRSRRRLINRISYEEPKLNRKLRQGDKFTFVS
ncbi:calcium calmodulin dependent protein kinase 4 [Plasmopara halstedii]|uniref:Calcium calmodulin dependent protein kinase 4 n=1 Tax=Plasmopara halstedii TaxID=4781 RepID=A0A0P1AJ72_PLAHL|nr:calcium calmodulin dependent protein kinase 4 [Plasmopara halstedii]CEG40912.1 calcium calmodulin dependent protein kinase 4 [Plasmopara halstedii]|eukprot:XP_024577281.1 calcium calmodulin dependent protein kinase 4 [Plasmopara halstedii]